MKGLGALLLLVSCDTALVSALLPPANVTISSRNFQHILTWDEPNSESPIFYSVEYIQNLSVVKKSQSCQNITRRQCDLSRDFTDIIVDYTAMVRSSSHGHTSEAAYSKQLNPFTDTVIGPAQVNVIPGDYSINVTVLPPVSHLWSEKEQRNVTMQSDDAYPMMEYTINLMNSTLVIPVIRDYNLDNRTITIPHLQPNANYCVSVSLYTSMNYQPPIDSEPKCVITGPTPQPVNVSLIVLPVVFGVLLLVGIIFLLVGLDKAGWICMERKFFPKVLKSIPQSESRFSGMGDCSPPPVYFDDVKILESRVEVEESKVNHLQYEPGGYANRKRLADSSGSAEGSSGQDTGATSSSDTSGQESGSSGVVPIGCPVDIPSDSEGSGSSGTPLLTHAIDSTSDFPLNNSGGFNINLNSVSIANPLEVWANLTPGVSVPEEPDAPRDCCPPPLSLNKDSFICTRSDLGIPGLAVSDIDYSNSEEDLSDHCDSEDPPVSGYMSR